MRGLTIVESLISVLILAVIMIGLGFAVVAGRGVVATTDIPTQLRQNVIFAVSYMVRELRQTAPEKTNLTIGSSSNAIAFKVPRDNNGDGSVVDNSGNIEWSADIIYARNGAGQLTRTSGGITKIIAPNIAILQFSRPVAEDSLIQIDITARKADQQGRWLQDSEQAILKMRN